MGGKLCKMFLPAKYLPISTPKLMPHPEALHYNYDNPQPFLLWWLGSCSPEHLEGTGLRNSCLKWLLGWGRSESGVVSWPYSLLYVISLFHTIQTMQALFQYISRQNPCFCVFPVTSWCHGLFLFWFILRWSLALLYSHKKFFSTVKSCLEALHLQLVVTHANHSGWEHPARKCSISVENCCSPKHFY